MDKLFVCIIALLLIAGMLPIGLGQEQYLEKYEYGKSYSFTSRNRILGGVWEEQQNQIKEFLWEHWKTRRLGYLDETYRNLEGEMTTVRYYIEACNPIDWCVTEFTRGVNNERGRKGLTWMTTRCVTAITLKRIDKRQYRSGITVEIPEDEIRSPDSYLLRLYDKDGNLIREK
jgi:hypothetical protein